MADRRRLTKVLCAPNALKGTLSALQAADAIAEGVRKVLPNAEIVPLPIADGGDGTCAVLVAALGGTEVRVPASDPLGRPLFATYGVVDGGRTAVLDVASASGLALLESAERDPLRASSRGTGELLARALASGQTEIILGVGGSATVDGGAGLLSALGARFLDACGNLVPAGGGGLRELAHIDTAAIADAARSAKIVVACDVENPLVGPEGAARAFAPQKGADARAVAELEAALEVLASVLEKTCGRSVRGRPFGGAAGGISASLHALLNAELVSGVDLVLDRIGFDAHLADAVLVITAEGRLDAGSLRNKGPVGVARRALRRGIPTLALVGSIDPALDVRATPFADVLAIGAASDDWTTLRRETPSRLACAAENAVRARAKQW